MVEPVSITAFIIALISAAGLIIKTITDAISHSSCTSTETISRNGSVKKEKKFVGNTDSN